MSASGRRIARRGAGRGPTARSGRGSTWARTSSSTSRAARRTRCRGHRRTDEGRNVTNATPTATPRLATVGLPDFGEPGPRPELPVQRYGERVPALRARADARGYDRLVIYADREHSANLAFLPGFDPRFEEAMLI